MLDFGADLTLLQSVLEKGVEAGGCSCAVVEWRADINSMTADQRGRMAKVLSAFVDAHPGTRRGQLFGRLAAFAGPRPFAEITDRGLACRVTGRLARDSGAGRALFLPDSRPGWVVFSPDVWRDADVVVLTTLLERAAANVAVGESLRSP